MIIDESDGDVGAAARALAGGYAGTSHKNCKGVIKSIANACLIAHRRRTRPGAARTCSAREDLSNVGPVALQQDLAVVATLGIDHVERNGHHYFRGLSMLPRETVRAGRRRTRGPLPPPAPTGRRPCGSKAGGWTIGSVVDAPFGLARAVRPDGVHAARRVGVRVARDRASDVTRASRPCESSQTTVRHDALRTGGTPVSRRIATASRVAGRGAFPRHGEHDDAQRRRASPSRSRIQLWARHVVQPLGAGGGERDQRDARGEAEQRAGDVDRQRHAASSRAGRWSCRTAAPATAAAASTSHSVFSRLASTSARRTSSHFGCSRERRGHARPRERRARCRSTAWRRQRRRRASRGSPTRKPNVHPATAEVAYVGANATAPSSASAATK